MLATSPTALTRSVPPGLGCPVPAAAALTGAAVAVVGAAAVGATGTGALHAAARPAAVAVMSKASTCRLLIRPLAELIFDLPPAPPGLCYCQHQRILCQ